MSKKARSDPMQEILKRLNHDNLMELIYFPDDMLLNTPIEEWPEVDVVIGFHSNGFPLKKAIAYEELRGPYSINSLKGQLTLLSRFESYKKMARHSIPLPRHILACRRPPPEERRCEACRMALPNDQGLRYADSVHCTCVYEDPVGFVDGGSYVEYNGVRIMKPFLEKPADSEDHNIWIYYPPPSAPGDKPEGVTKLFRKVGNRSSEFIPGKHAIRRNGCYIYEAFLPPQDNTDVKIYAVFPNYILAETRKAPHIDGIVVRDPETKKEVRALTELSVRERDISMLIWQTFGQRVCGFDFVRSEGKTVVCDVNGWSFVKTNPRYYDVCARILRELSIQAITQSQKDIARALKFPRDELLPNALHFSRVTHPSVVYPKSGTYYIDSTYLDMLDKITEMLVKRRQGGMENKSTIFPAMNDILFSRYKECTLRRRGFVGLIRSGDRVPKFWYAITSSNQWILTLFAGVPDNELGSSELRQQYREKGVRDIIIRPSYTPMRAKGISDTIEALLERKGINPQEIRHTPFLFLHKHATSSRHSRAPTDSVDFFDESTITKTSDGLFPTPRVLKSGLTSDPDDDFTVEELDALKLCYTLFSNEIAGVRIKLRRQDRATTTFKLSISWGGYLTVSGLRQAFSLGKMLRRMFIPYIPDRILEPDESDGDLVEGYVSTPSSDLLEKTQLLLPSDDVPTLSAESPMEQKSRSDLYKRTLRVFFSGERRDRHCALGVLIGICTDDSKEIDDIFPQLCEYRSYELSPNLMSYLSERYQPDQPIPYINLSISQLRQMLVYEDTILHNVPRPVEELLEREKTRINKYLNEHSTKENYLTLPVFTTATQQGSTRHLSILSGVDNLDIERIRTGIGNTCATIAMGDLYRNPETPVRSLSKLFATTHTTSSDICQGATIGLMHKSTSYSSLQEEMIPAMPFGTAGETDEDEALMDEEPRNEWSDSSVPGIPHLPTSSCAESHLSTSQLSHVHSWESLPRLRCSTCTSEPRLSSEIDLRNRTSIRQHFEACLKNEQYANHIEMANDIYNFLESFLDELEHMHFRTAPNLSVSRRATLHDVSVSRSDTPSAVSHVDPVDSRFSPLSIISQIRYVLYDFRVGNQYDFSAIVALNHSMRFLAIHFPELASNEKLDRLISLLSRYAVQVVHTIYGITMSNQANISYQIAGVLFQTLIDDLSEVTTRQHPHHTPTPDGDLFTGSQRGKHLKGQRSDVSLEDSMMAKLYVGSIPWIHSILNLITLNPDFSEFLIHSREVTRHLSFGASLSFVLWELVKPGMEPAFLVQIFYSSGASADVFQHNAYNVQPLDQPEPLMYPIPLFLLTQFAAKIPKYRKRLASDERLFSMICVVRHADRTPKQRLKFKVDRDDLAQRIMKRLRISEIAPTDVTFRAEDPAERLAITEISEEVKAWMKLIEEHQVSASVLADSGVQKLVEHLTQFLIVVTNPPPALKVQLKFPFPWRGVRRFTLLAKYDGVLTTMGRLQSHLCGRLLYQTLLDDFFELGVEIMPGSLNRVHDLLKGSRKYCSDEPRVRTTAEECLKEIVDNYNQLAQDLQCSQLLDQADITIEELPLLSKVDKIARELISMEKETLNKALTEKIDLSNENPKNLQGCLLDFIRSIPHRALEELGVPFTRLEELRRLLTDLITGYEEYFGDKDQFPEGFQTILQDGETIHSIIRRIHFIAGGYYDPETQTYNVSKIADITDLLRYEILQHHYILNERLQRVLKDAWDSVRVLIPFTASQEFGLTDFTKFAIASFITRDLLNMITDNLRTPGLSFYFTSESHIHGLLNLLLCSPGSPCKVDRDSVSGVDFLSHFVFKGYARGSNDFCSRIEVYWSRGSAHSPYKIDMSLAENIIRVQAPLLISDTLCLKDFEAILSHSQNITNMLQNRANDNLPLLPTH